MNLEEALEASVMEDVVAINDNTIVVNNDLRTMSIPEKVSILGVESDESVNRLKFRLPRYYCDLDLGEFNIYVNYLNGRTEDIYVVTDKKTTSEYVEFSWLVGRNASKNKGYTKFVLCLKKSGSDGTVIKEFNTTVHKLEVLEGLETEVDTSLITQNKDLNDLIDQIKIMIDLEGEKVISNLPKDYQELINEVKALKDDLGDITQIDKSSNILKISDYTEGRYYSASSGDYRYNNDFSTVDNYVEVEPSCSYVLSEFINGVFETLISTIIIFYDKNKKFLSGDQCSTFITPEDAKYIRLSLKKDLIGKQLLVEKGTEPTKIWVPYYKELHLKGGRIIDLSYGVLKNNPTINGVEVSGDKSLEDYGITKASEIAETYGLCKTNEITVDINGNGDFRKLQDAVNSITDNFQNNRYVIYIKEGEYDLAEGITDGENDASIVGVTIPNWTTLKGVGDRKNIILQAKFKNKMQYVSTLNFKETGGIENLTVIGENTRYTIHDDDARNANGYERNVKHCIIKGLSTYYSVVYGSGSGDGAKWDFEDVVFDGTETGANKKSGNTFTVHNLLASKQNRNITFKNCIFKSANNGNVKFKTLAYRTATGKDDARNMVTNVALYGCKFEGVTKGFELVEENPDVYGKGCYYYVNGFGNINAGYEIITTDDKDYSDRVNLI